MLESLQQHIEHAIQERVHSFTKPEWMYDPVHYALESGGKRIRPLLTVLASLAVGGTMDHAMPAAVAVEILHNFTLVHDDITDNSPLRRGRASVHVKWDSNVAIISGDVMIGIALDSLMQSAVHAADPVQVIRDFNRGLIDVCEGQAKDISLSLQNDVHEHEYFEMIEYKTARLLEMAVIVGARVGNASEDIVEHLRLFARNIGIAFQLQDDVLDLFGNPDFGKTQGGDVIEGKQTLIMIRAKTAARRSGNGDYITLMDEFTRNRGLRADRIPEVVSMVNSLGILHDIRSQIQSLTAVAFEHLDALPYSDGRNDLQMLAHRLMDRTV